MWIRTLRGEGQEAERERNGEMESENKDGGEDLHVAVDRDYARRE